MRPLRISVHVRSGDNEEDRRLIDLHDLIVSQAGSRVWYRAWEVIQHNTLVEVIKYRTRSVLWDLEKRKILR